MSISMFEGFKFTRLDTPMHRMDPRAKFLIAIVFFTAAIIFSNIMVLLTALAAQIPLILLGKAIRRWASSIRSASILASLIFLMNFITGSPLTFSAAMAVRFLVLVSSFSLFFMTTSPDDLGLALEGIGVPYPICFTFTMAVRLVPTMAVDAQRVMDAQKSRGLELEKGNILRRVRNYVPILIPLIVNAVRRSMEMAEALESRGFTSAEKREPMKILTLSRMDYLTIILSVASLILLVYVRLYVSIPTFDIPYKIKLF
ncbi:MAG: energy-coupling factor transporter transmembrane component T [Candidatus Bathyarchaeia archaeon]|nr:energy-coupling factor transporter transmembrane protein EcfT [Candidatus Bathyarchaeota archaeon]